jgi:hypothetical protein
MRIRFTPLLLFVSPLVVLVAAAYLQWATVGLPAVPPVAQAVLDAAPSQGEGGYNEDHEYFGELANI